jgi:hypothetical protein
MKTATTIQFRDAVRQALNQENTGFFRSWTDIAPSGGRKRYVGIWPCGGLPTQQDAQAVEQILGKQGLTAETRVSSWYVRGTCVL